MSSRLRVAMPGERDLGTPQRRPVRTYPGLPNTLTVAPALVELASSVVGLGRRRLVAGHLAKFGAVGGRLVTVLGGPRPVDSGSVSIRLVESLAVSVLLGAYHGRGVAGFRGTVTQFGGSVPDIGGVDQFAQPLLAAL